jgi:hypothetical protein
MRKAVSTGLKMHIACKMFHSQWNVNEFIWFLPPKAYCCKGDLMQPGFC